MTENHIRLRALWEEYLEANDKLRQGMIEGLHDQLNSSVGRQDVVQSIQHEGWKVDLIKSEQAP